LRFTSIDLKLDRRRDLESLRLDQSVVHILLERHGTCRQNNHKQLTAIQYRLDILFQRTLRFISLVNVN